MPELLPVPFGGDCRMRDGPFSLSRPVISSGDIAVVFLSLLGFVGTVECLVLPGRRGDVGGLGAFDPDELVDMNGNVRTGRYKKSIPLKARQQRYTGTAAQELLGNAV